MKILPIIAPCWVAAALVVGCDVKTPTGQPSDVVGIPALAADQNWVEGSFAVNFLQSVGCTGEIMNFYGEVPYRYHEVASNSGNYSYHYQLLNWAQSPAFYAEGTSSGTLFQFQAGPYNETFAAGPGEVLDWNQYERYMAEKGNWFECTANYHSTVNANGELTAEKMELFGCTCHLKD